MGESVWLSVEQIRKRERIRRQAVLSAMASGALPHERRGRVRYALLSDVQEWERGRLTFQKPGPITTTKVHAALADLL